jgi:hypothetical protein
MSGSVTSPDMSHAVSIYRDNTGGDLALFDRLVGAGDERRR